MELKYVFRLLDELDARPPEKEFTWHDLKWKYSRHYGSQRPGRPYQVKDGSSPTGRRYISDEEFLELQADAYDEGFTSQRWCDEVITFNSPDDPNLQRVRTLAAEVGFEVVTIPHKPPKFQERLLSLLADGPLTSHQLAAALRTSPNTPFGSALNQTFVTLHRLMHQGRITRNAETLLYSPSPDHPLNTPPDRTTVKIRLIGTPIINFYETEEPRGLAADYLAQLLTQLGAAPQSMLIHEDAPHQIPKTRNKGPRNHEAKAQQRRARLLVAMRRDAAAADPTHTTPPVTFEDLIKEVYFPVVDATEGDAQIIQDGLAIRIGQPQPTLAQLQAVRDKARRLRKHLCDTGKLRCVRTNIAGLATWLVYEHDDPAGLPL